MESQYFVICTNVWTWIEKETKSIEDSITCSYNSIIVRESFILTNFVTDVKVDSREVAKGTATTLTCIVFDLTEKAVIKWFLEALELESSDDYSISGDDHIDSEGSQTSKLTIHNPTESTVFNCQVSSILYSNSASSETLAHLYVYGSSI